MAEVLAYRRNKTGAAGDRDLAEPATPTNALPATVGGHPLDGPEARKVHQRLLSWFYFERDRQAANRLEMAIDHDFYDGDQWDEEAIATLENRRQLAVVYNECAPMCDWMIGTERRNRVDWRVLPRSEDDVEIAEVKSETLKFVADVNNTAHNRSTAFSDAVKGGIGWTDDGARDDPTKDVLYSQYEDWRCVLHDSTAMDQWGDEGRYRFRWRWVDEDIAAAMFPDRRNKILEAVEDWAHNVDAMVDELDWSDANTDAAGRRSGSLSPLHATSTSVDAQRRRVRLIEGQYKEPVITKFIADGPLRGAMFDPRDKALIGAHAKLGGTIVDRITMRVHVAVFTEAAMLAMGPSRYRHNKFSLTPIICYLRGRDRQPYGMIRRVRTVQMDINKRASKANWLVNTNQLIGDEDAFEDWDEAREQAQDPQGALPHKKGAQVEIRRDAEAAKGQLDMMQIGVQSIQRNSVSNENLGRQTNATSEVAIRARQLQGSVTTTEPFDNLRLSVKTQGEKQLSLIEQFYSEEKVLRLTGAKGPIKWVKLNVPEVQPDGTGALHQRRHCLHGGFRGQRGRLRRHAAPGDVRLADAADAAAAAGDRAEAAAHGLRLLRPAEQGRHRHRDPAPDGRAGSVQEAQPRGAAAAGSCPAGAGRGHADATRPGAGHAGGAAGQGAQGQRRGREGHGRDRSAAPERRRRRHAGAHRGRRGAGARASRRRDRRADAAAGQGHLIEPGRALQGQQGCRHRRRGRAHPGCVGRAGGRDPAGQRQADRRAASAHRRPGGDAEGNEAEMTSKADTSMAAWALPFHHQSTPKAMKSLFNLIRSFLLAAAIAMAGLASMPAHATSFTDYLENKLVDWLLRGQSFTPPATVYISLHTSACSDSATGTEVSGGSYARVAVTSSLANWAGTQAAASTSVSSGTSGTTSNNAAINFPTPSASWGTVTYFGIYDASSSGNMLVCQALTASKTINSGDTVSFAAAALTLQIDN